MTESLSSASEGLTVYTVQSTMIFPGWKPMSTSYDQIVGIEPETGAVLWIPHGQEYRGFEPYSKKNVEQRSIPTSPILTQRLVGIWTTRCMVPRPPRYNCHLVAGVWQQGEGAVNPPTHVVRTGHKVDRLHLGQRGVVGVRRASGSYADHSMGGLGRNNPEALQAMCMNGALGIAVIDAILTYYDELASSTAPKHGLYVE